MFTKRIACILTITLSVLVLFGCSAEAKVPADTGTAVADESANESVLGAVDFDHELNDYDPEKDQYSFFFTYKIVHPWWDAVALGMEEAQRQYLDRGVAVTYEYMAPDDASADDQIERLTKAEDGDYDVIGVDVADADVISPVLDEMVDSGYKVMTFSSSDAHDGCKRIAYVGNTHNYQDGADLTEALCRKLDYTGKMRSWSEVWVPPVMKTELRVRKIP